MPWGIDDVEQFKKGLTDKQKKQWVRIANSVLARCIKAGGTDETCAPKAIKQANGVLTANSAYTVHRTKYEGDYEVELLVHQGKPYYKVPVVMMVEGVHEGSRGALFHSIEELGKLPASWNGIPVVIDHPEQEGTFVSANTPDIIDARTVGRVYNTFVDGSKLKAEVWLDEERLHEVCPEALEDIVNNKVREVSVGVFNEEIEEEGTWNGEEYIAIATNHHPDHLAILTSAVGACSCADGCGLGVNSEEDMKKGIEFAKDLQKVGLKVVPIDVNEDVSYREKMDAAWSALRSFETANSYCYLEEMYDDFLIYVRNSDGENKMYKQTYSYESGDFTLTGEPVEVHREVAYVTNNSSTNQKEVNMSKECPPCKEKVDALIANSKGRWTNEDRAFLETLTEAQLDKMAPVEIEVEKVVEKEIEVNKLTPQQEADLAFVANMRAEKKRKMISEIQTNTAEGVWTDDVLGKMDDDTLNRIHKSVYKEKVETVDYSLSGSGPAAYQGAEVEMLPPAGISFE